MGYCATKQVVSGHLCLTLKRMNLGILLLRYIGKSLQLSSLVCKMKTDILLNILVVKTKVINGCIAINLLLGTQKFSQSLQLWLPFSQYFCYSQWVSWLWEAALSVSFRIRHKE